MKAAVVICALYYFAVLYVHTIDTPAETALQAQIQDELKRVSATRDIIRSDTVTSKRFETARTLIIKEKKTNIIVDKVLMVLGCIGGAVIVIGLAFYWKKGYCSEHVN